MATVVARGRWLAGLEAGGHVGAVEAFVIKEKLIISNYT